MSRNLRVALLLGLGLVLGGCGSTPESVTRWHSLRSTTPQAAPVATPAAAWSLAPVQVASHLDRPQMVLRRTDGAWMVLEHERWLSPLVDEVHAALSARLTQRMGPSRSDGTRIAMSLQRLDASVAGDTLLVAEWSLDAAGRRLVCRSQAHAIATASVAAIVAAQRELLAVLAEQWTRTLIAVTAGTVACPQ